MYLKECNAGHVKDLF